MTCRICNTTPTEILMRTFDDRYGYPGNFAMTECHHCGHKSLNFDLSTSQLTDLYTNYYPRKNLDVANFIPHSEQGGFTGWFNGAGSSAFRWVPKNVRVLDVGCGFGQSLGYHKARGCDVYGVEADQNIRRVVDKFGFNVHVGLFDDAFYEPDFFDYVTMDQVFEHVTDPFATLQGVSRILKPGGTAVLSTPNSQGWGARLFGRRWINWHTPYHLQFYTRQSMQKIAEEVGLELSEVKTITSSEWLFYQLIHLVNYPKEGTPSCFWSPDYSGTRFHKKIIVKLLSLLHKTKINHCITRVFDGIGLGDNYLFILRKS